MKIGIKKFLGIFSLMTLLFSLLPVSVSALPVSVSAGSAEGNSIEVYTSEGYTYCANEGGTCTFTGKRTVAYGANGVFAYKSNTTSIDCNNTIFGDPIGEVVKSCYYSNVTTEDTLPPTTSDDAPDQWVNQEITVNLTASDDHDSVVAATYYILDDSTQQSGTSVYLNVEGAHTIEFWSVDHAGHEETHHSKTVTLKFIPLNSNGQFHIGDLVHLIHQGTSQQKEMNGDDMFDDQDIRIMLKAIMPVFSSSPVD